MWQYCGAKYFLIKNIFCLYLHIKLLKNEKLIICFFTKKKPVHVTVLWGGGGGGGSGPGLVVLLIRR